MGDAGDKLRNKPSSADLDEASVLGYLLENPDFLMDHPEVLMVATPPARFEAPGNNKVVDIQHIMLKRLQTEMADLQDCAEQLIITTRSNMSTQKGTLQAALAVMDCEGLSSVARTIAEDLPMLLDVDSCALRLERHVMPPEGLDTNPAGDDDQDVVTLPAGFIETLFGAEAHAVLRPSVDTEAVIHGEAAGAIRSDALVRIDAGPDLPPGLFALGSRVEGTFEPEMALDLLIFLARVVEHAVRRWAPESL
ncbi:MAG: DUF484 family protein [Rhodospirillum sp.]|nr:DUF484 family protein [Rhodospirillum sp.]MCF8490347.1 DUF484 family protein [Rhodospirillum sp.]MCF8501990.1 DUF484 family protein [Rhodospirillum sp.]